MPGELDFHHKWMSISFIQNFSSLCLTITAAGMPLLQPAWPPRVLNIIIEIQVSGLWENLYYLEVSWVFLNRSSNI